MLQIKTFPPSSAVDARVNEFLRTVKSEDVVRIEVKETGFAFVTYEVREAWKDRICSECKYWDDGNSSDSVSGLCHECGGRKRFNCRACEKFRDVRD